MLDWSLIARFHHEAQTAAQLCHSNIVPVYAAGCERGVHYYAMQYIEGNVWVTDFGLARFPTEADLITTGDISGTLQYMRPEQAAGRRDLISPRTDVYSLGITLYELLTFRAALESTERPELLRRIAHENPPLHRLINPSIPHDLETIVLKAIAKSPDQRHDTARDLADDLRHFQAELPAETPRRAFASPTGCPDRQTGGGIHGNYRS